MKTYKRTLHFLQKCRFSFFQSQEEEKNLKFGRKHVIAKLVKRTRGSKLFLTVYFDFRKLGKTYVDRCIFYTRFLISENKTVKSGAPYRSCLDVRRTRRGNNLLYL